MPLPCMCSHTATYVSSYYYDIRVLILLHMCPHTLIDLALSCLMLLHMCPHTTTYVMPHTTTYVSSYYYIRVLMLIDLAPSYYA
jgi:uncharacterized membrane protein